MSVDRKELHNLDVDEVATTSLRERAVKLQAVFSKASGGTAALSRMICGEEASSLANLLDEGLEFLDTITRDVQITREGVHPLDGTIVRPYNPRPLYRFYAEIRNRHDKTELTEEDAMAEMTNRAQELRATLKSIQEGHSYSSDDLVRFLNDFNEVDNPYFRYSIEATHALKTNSFRAL